MSNPRLNRNELDPNLLRAGVLAGLLANLGPGDSEVELRLEWFQDPVGALQHFSGESIEQLFELLEQFWPKTVVGGDTWYSISGGGLGVVRRHSAASDVCGIGYRDAGGGTGVRPAVFVPLFDFKSKDRFIAGKKGYAIEAGLELGAGGEPVLKTKSAQVGSVRIAADLDVAAPELKLPRLVLKDVRWDAGSYQGQQATFDMAELIERASGDIGGAVDVVLELLFKELGSAGESAVVVLRNMKVLAGLGSRLGTVFDGQAFFARLAGDQHELKRWLGALTSLLEGREPGKSENGVSGTGTETDPFVLPLVRMDNGGRVGLTFAQAPQELKIGLTVATGTQSLAEGVAAVFSAEAGLLRLKINEEAILAEKPKANLELRMGLQHPVGRGDGNPPLYSRWIHRDGDFHRIELGSVCLGLDVDLAMGAALSPSVVLQSVENGKDGRRIDVDLLQLRTRAADSSAEWQAWSGPEIDVFLRGLAAALSTSFEGLSVQPVYETDHERIERNTAQSSLSAALKWTGALTGINGADGISALADALIALSSFLAKGGNIAEGAAEWAKSKINDGSWLQALGKLLALQNRDFAGEKGRLVYRPAEELAISLATAENGGLALGVDGQFAAGSARLKLAGAIEATWSGSITPALHVELGMDQRALEELERCGIKLAPEALIGYRGGEIKVEFYPFGRSLAKDFTLSFLPKLASLQGTKNEPLEQWLLRLSVRALLPALETKLLNYRHNGQLVMDARIVEILSAGEVLTAWGLLKRSTEEQAPYHFARWDDIRGLRPEGLLGAIASTLVERQPGNEADGLRLIKKQSGDSTEYGIRLCRSDISLGDTRAGAQLGSWLQTGDSSTSNWLTESGSIGQWEPGMAIRFLRKSPSGWSLTGPEVELVSVGLDLSGKDNLPLLQLGGYEVRQIRSRLYFDSERSKFGAAVELRDFGLPLGPRIGKDAATNNGVAASLLGSENADAQEKTGSPTFSGYAAWSEKLTGKLVSDIPSADGRVWVPVEKSLGPLYCRQIGLGLDTENARLQVGYDGGVSLGALAINLERLTMGIPLKSPLDFSQYQLDLDGMDVSFASGPVQVTGGLYRAADRTKVSYDGLALVKAQDFTITGFGSYAQEAGAPSLFIFGVMHRDLGGPACFHVTGVAAGFGYNRELRLPTIENVHSFPLVRAALDERYVQGSGKGAVSAALEKLREYVPPQKGRYWLAIGVRFSSFEMIQSFGLLSVSFGGDVEIGLLGLSTLSIPRGAKPGSAVFYAELALRAVIRPAEGSVQVQGRLTGNSYVFSPDCKLTGGFAFFTWFSGEHEGDFVLSMGGYHPRFVLPSHYPEVPRLAIAWKIDENLHVSGEQYFALTPSCLMAGGRLSAIYKSGWIEAWFTAYAHLLMNWQPFHYEVEMGITIGVACRVSIDVWFTTISFTLRVSLSVELRLWGPPFSGEVYVDLSIVSFTIRFGQSRQPVRPLQPQQFVEAFLPARQNSGGMLRGAAGASSDVITVSVSGGLMRRAELAGGGSAMHVVNAQQLVLAMHSTIPVTEFDGAARSEKKPANIDLSQFGVKPMGKVCLRSVFKVVFRRQTGAGETDVPADLLNFSVVTSGVPDALWGRSAIAGRVEVPQDPAAKTLQAMVGIRVALLTPEPEHALNSIALEKLKWETMKRTVPWSDPGMPISETHPQDAFWSAITDPMVRERRTDVLAILGASSPFTLNRPDLSQMIAARDAYFQAMPQVCALGQRLN